MSTPSGTFLIEQEIRELTGYAFPRLQIKWLSEKRWPFEIDRFNRPVVLRSVMECRLGDPDSTQESWSLDPANVA